MPAAILLAVRLNKLLCTRLALYRRDYGYRNPANSGTMDQESSRVVSPLWYGVDWCYHAEGRLVGIITLDDIIDVIDEEAEEDLMALAGVSDASIRTSVLETLKGRAPWLFGDLITAVIASVVIGFFESTIEKLLLSLS